MSWYPENKPRDQWQQKFVLWKYKQYKKKAAATNSESVQLVIKETTLTMENGTDHWSQ